MRKIKIVNTVSCDKNDWRFQGQDKYLDNISLIKSQYVVTDPTWDHDHCDFCMDKFSEREGDLRKGYCTADEKHWICEKCFHDFSDMFHWIVR